MGSCCAVGSDRCKPARLLSRRPYLPLIIESVTDRIPRERAPCVALHPSTFDLCNGSGLRVVDIALLALEIDTENME